MVVLSCSISSSLYFCLTVSFYFLCIFQLFSEHPREPDQGWTLEL